MKTIYIGDIHGRDIWKEIVEEHKDADNGTVAGLLDAHAYFGKLELSEVLAPVIAQATNGIVVSYDLHKAIESTPRLFSDIESRKIYFEIDKTPIKENSLLKLPDLARTLTLISEKGKDGFYKGETAKKIVKAMKSYDGLIEQKDSLK